MAYKTSAVHKFAIQKIMYLFKLLDEMITFVCSCCGSQSQFYVGNHLIEFVVKCYVIRTL